MLLTETLSEASQLCVCGASLKHTETNSVSEKLSLYFGSEVRLDGGRAKFRTPETRVHTLSPECELALEVKH